MPRCAICGKRLGLNSERVHIVTKDGEGWLCYDHWLKLQELSDSLFSYRVELNHVKQVQAKLEDELSELLRHLNRRRKGPRAVADRVSCGGAKPPA
jgi:hypothetical protein